MIVERLHEIQHRVGYLPDADLEQVAREAEVPLYRVQEVASFFPHFRQAWDPPPDVEVRICRDMSCHLAGSATLLHGPNGLRDELVALGQAQNRRVVVSGVSCLGRCDRAPACSVNRTTADPDAAFHDRVYAGLNPTDLRDALVAIVEGANPPPEDTPDGMYSPHGDQRRWLIDVYRQFTRDHYDATRQFLTARPGATPEPGKPPPSREELTKLYLAELRTATLLGMGGAGAPVAQKWLDVAEKPAGDGPYGQDKYVVCNGDESEPGTFKDREILLKMPHLVVEGVLLGLLMTGGTHGYIFIRHEYTEQIAAVREEIKRAEAALKPALETAGRAFPPIEVFESPGGYICGEQSALLEAMEDRRAQPRNRPPELTANGLRDRPTVVNNVESLAWVPAIVLMGANWYVKEGAGGGLGRRMFSISGDLRQPGVFEIKIGAPLGDLIAAAGGCLPGRKLKAVATSGPSAGFLPARLRLKADARDWITKALKGEPYRVGEALTQAGEMLQAFEQRLPKPDAPDGDTVPVEALPLDLNFFRGVASSKLLDLPPEIGLMLGAGLVVYDDTRDMLVEARNTTQFFRNESCGKCVPCRLGSAKLVGIGTELLRRRGGPVPADGDGPDGTPAEFMAQVKANVFDLAYVLNQTSICGLGPSAPNPLATVLQFFPKDAGLSAAPAGPPKKTP